MTGVDLADDSGSIPAPDDGRSSNPQDGFMPDNCSSDERPPVGRLY